MKLILPNVTVPIMLPGNYQITLHILSKVMFVINGDVMTWKRFSITDPSRGETTGDRWIHPHPPPPQRASNAEL